MKNLINRSTASMKAIKMMKSRKMLSPSEVELRSTKRIITFTQLRAGFTKRSDSSFRAFTIIELLVVVALIALIAAIGLASFSNARAKSRDARRLADAKTIQNALNLYTTNTRIFPNPTAAGGVCLTGSDPISTILINTSSITQVPLDPQHACGAGATDPPDAAHPHYQYESIDGSTFRLWFLLETGNVPGSDGYPPNCASYPCAKYVTP